MITVFCDLTLHTSLWKWMQT